MRKFIIDSFICGGLGLLLAYMGYPYNTWQFWVVLILFIGYRLNSID